MNALNVVRGWATNLVTLIRPALERIFVPRRQAGVLVNQDTALTAPEWFACVSVLTRTAASVPWCVNQRTGKSGRTELNNTLSWMLNNRPNPEMSAFTFRETILAHAINWGNGYAEIQFDGAGRPINLWLITPDRVEPDRDAEGNLIYKVSGADGLQTIMTPDRIFHLHGLGFDGLTGYSLVTLAARSIGVSIAQDTFAQSFYANGTVMGSLLEMPGTMNQQQISDAEKYYNDRHKGPSKAFTLRVAPAGVKTHAMGMPMTDAQFIESRQLSVTMAARWLGVPPHKIADLTRSTNNNIEHQSIEFVQDAIVPWAMRLEQEADAKLIGVRSRGRVYTKLNLNALMRGDAKSRAEFYRLMTQIGAMSINEVRALEDMNSIGPAGDEHLVQLNQTTLEWLVDNPGAKAVTAPPAADPEPAADEPPAKPTNVIRAQALQWLREQRRQA